ncbi:MAG: DoxX family protein [Sandaracinus sp.]
MSESTANPSPLTRTHLLPDAALALLRVALAALMLRHGIPKLLEFDARAAGFPDPLGVGHTTSLVLAIFGEVFCSLLLIPGVLVRLAAVPFCTTMAVAFFLVHAQDAFDDKELAFLYLVGGIVVLVGGGGRFSVDHWLLPKLRERFGKKPG